MWWSRRLIAVVLLLGLGACGFQPLYGQQGVTGGSIPDELASIRIVPIADRTGQLLYNHLRDRLNPQGKPADPRYILDITLREEREELAFRGDETATRSNLRLTANYVLRSAMPEGEGGADDIVTSGSARITASYDLLDSQYATIISIEDARARATRVLSDDIQHRLAVALSEFTASAP